ncbi:MAG TPA: hypothetical protein VK465_08695 [Fibrobacteria bacterium]|nr:hypothetical protein [Fibrobacteria bacterium]
MAFDPDKYLAEKQGGAAPAPGGFDPDAYLAEKAGAEPQGGGFLAGMGKVAQDYILPSAAFVGRQIDRVTTAPARAAIGEVQAAREARGGREEGLGKFLDPQEYADIGRFGLGYLKNFGRDPDKAPTPQETAESYGIPRTPLSEVLPSFYSETGEGVRLKKGGLFDPTASGAAGMAAEIAAPLPGLGAVKGAVGATGRAVAPVAKMAAEGGARAVDFATGTKAGTKTLGAAKTLGKSIDETTEGLKSMMKAKQADDFGESVKTAIANGIDPKLLPEAVEFGPSSVVSRSARVKAEGPLGQPMLEKFEQGHRAVQDAITRDVQKIAGGRLLNPVEAGEAMREGFNAGVDRAFSEVATSHNQILQAAPDLRLTPERIQSLASTLQDMEAWAQRKIDLGSTKTAKTQGRQILEAVASIRKSGESYRGALDALREIGATAFKSTNTAADIAPDIARYRQLYGALNDAMIGTVDDAFDAGTAQALRESNAAMSKIFGDKSLLGKLGEKNLSGEELFRALAKGGSTKEIQALKEYLTPEQLAGVKGAFLHDMVKLNPQGEFTFRSTFNRLRDNWDTAEALFEPGELDNFVSLLRLGDKFGPAVMSTSGTGASNAFMDFFRTARDRGTDALITEPIKKKARAIGFDINEQPSRAAAKKPGPGPIMGFGPGGRFGNLPNFNPRYRAARAYSLTTEEDEEQ